MLRCYYMDISCDCSFEQSQALYGCLPEEREAKIRKLKNAGMAKKRLLSSSFLQYGLSHTLGILPEKLSYQYGKFGKPSLSEASRKYIREQKGDSAGDMEFNLSHSGKYAVLAISDAAVGIDVEREKKNRLAVAKRCFCEKEYESIVGAESYQEQNKRFLEYWTMKEAYVKYVGTGLIIPLNSFQIQRGENAISSVQTYLEGQSKEHTGLEEVYIMTCFLEEQYCVSICNPCKEDLEFVRMNGKSSPHGMKEIFIKDLLNQ